MSTADMVMIGLAIVILIFAFWPRSQAGHFVAPTMPIHHAPPPQPVTPDGAYSSFMDVIQRDGGRLIVSAASEQHARNQAAFLAQALSKFNASPPAPPAS